MSSGKETTFSHLAIFGMLILSRLNGVLWAVNQIFSFHQRILVIFKKLRILGDCHALKNVPEEIYSYLLNHL